MTSGRLLAEHQVISREILGFMLGFLAEVVSDQIRVMVDCVTSPLFVQTTSNVVSGAVGDNAWESNHVNWEAEP